MWRYLDRALKTMADVTVGTVIVLVHVALAERRARGDHLARSLAAPDLVAPYPGYPGHPAGHPGT